MTDWTKDLINFGESRNWQLPHRRPLKKFRDYLDDHCVVAYGDDNCDLPYGIAADRAFRCGYYALADATPEERAACTDWQAVKELQLRQEAERAAMLKERQQTREAELDLIADQDGWQLLAGEETELVATGTRSHVVSLLPAVTKHLRDSYEGIGCWVVIAPDGTEAANGKFDEDMYW